MANISRFLLIARLVYISQIDVPVVLERPLADFEKAPPRHHLTRLVPVSGDQVRLIFIARYSMKVPGVPFLTKCAFIVTINPFFS